MTQNHNEMPAESGQSELAAVSLSEIILGRKLEAPLYDINGVLLLSAGNVLTAEILQSLRKRGDKSVFMSPQDFRRLTLQTQPIDGPQSTSLQTGLTRELDALIDENTLALNNVGPPVKDRVRYPGFRGYDHEQHERLVKQHQNNVRAIQGVMKQVLQGQKANGMILVGIADQFLQEMTQDTDCVLSWAVNQYDLEDITCRSLETALLAMAIGIEMELDETNIRHLAIAGMVHDWGMLRVPIHIRESRERLSPISLLEIKKHPIHTLEMLQFVTQLPRVVSIISYQMHERFNGTGYPRGRRGKQIHPLARILQVADAFVSMTSPRPYRPAMMKYAAMECLIYQARESLVEPQVVRALLRVQCLFPIGTYVTLSDGAVAQVLRRNKEHYTQPIVLRVQDSNGRPVDREASANMIDLHQERHLQVKQALPSPGCQEIPFDEDFYKSVLISRE